MRVYFCMCPIPTQVILVEKYHYKHNLNTNYFGTDVPLCTQSRHKLFRCRCTNKKLCLKKHCSTNSLVHVRLPESMCVYPGPCAFTLAFTRRGQLQDSFIFGGGVREGRQPPPPGYQQAKYTRRCLQKDMSQNIIFLLCMVRSTAVVG